MGLLQTMACSPMFLQESPVRQYLLSKLSFTLRKSREIVLFQTQVGRAADAVGHQQQRPDDLVHQHHGQQQPEQGSR